MVMNFFTYVATETRELMAQLGVKPLAGSDWPYDLLEFCGRDQQAARTLDWSLLFTRCAGGQAAVLRIAKQRGPLDKGLDAEREMVEMARASRWSDRWRFRDATDQLRSRSIARAVSGESPACTVTQGMVGAPLLPLQVPAGQSFGVVECRA